MRERFVLVRCIEPDEYSKRKINTCGASRKSKDKYLDGRGSIREIIDVIGYKDRNDGRTHDTYKYPASPCPG